MEAVIPRNEPSPATAGQATAAARVSALGTELIEIHDWLRQALHRLRTEVGAAGGDAGTWTRTLRAHCTGFCSALTSHHTSEDRTAFPALAAQIPELAPLLQELRRDHELIGPILRRVEQLAADPSPDAAPDAGSELDGLAAVLESHFRWEERRLADALNSLELPGSVEPGATPSGLFGKLPPA